MNTVTDVSGEKNVRMSNASFARLIDPKLLVSWTTLRVAVRMRIEDLTNTMTGTPRFAVGLCSGTSNLLGDVTTTHFVGAYSYSTSWTRSTAEIRYSSSFTAMKRVGSTITDASGAGSVATVLPHTAYYKLFFVDITKGSPNFTVNGFFPTSNNASNPTAADFITQSAAGSPSFTGHAAGTNRTIAVDEGTDGTLNAACVWWNQVTNYMDIAAVRVIKLA